LVIGYCVIALLLYCSSPRSVRDRGELARAKSHSKRAVQAGVHLHASRFVSPPDLPSFRTEVIDLPAEHRSVRETSGSGGRKNLSHRRTLPREPFRVTSYRSIAASDQSSVSAGEHPSPRATPSVGDRRWTTDAPRTDVNLLSASAICASPGDDR